MTQSKGGMNSIARVDGGVDITTGALAGRTVTASTTDSIRGLFKWFRSPDDQTANNETRKIFRDAISEMFGGDSKIPDSVRDAMRMADFNKDKPLTARRILIVKEAIDAAIDAAIAHAKKLKEAGRVISTADWGKKDVQRMVAGGKPKGLPQVGGQSPKSTEFAKKVKGSVADHSVPLFRRDLLPYIAEPGWFEA